MILDLQNSALNSLTSLLKIEIDAKESNSVKNLLDGTRTPRVTLSPRMDERDNSENISPNSTAKKTSSKSVSGQRSLQQLYTRSLLNDKRGNSTTKESESATKETNFVIAGAELCRILLYMLEIVNIKGSTLNNFKKKTLILNSLTNLLCVSLEAKKYALNNELMTFVVKQIREIHLKLSLESVESLRRLSDKKRITPVLQEIHTLTGLLTNFMAGDANVKNAAVYLELADLVHKMWVWISTQKNLLVVVLKMLCTYTCDSPAGMLEKLCFFLICFCSVLIIF